MQKQATAEDLKKIFESDSFKLEKKKQIESSGLFSRLRRMPEERIMQQVVSYCVPAKTELLSPEGKVLMRDGELVEDCQPVIKFGIDFGWSE